MTRRLFSDRLSRRDLIELGLVSAATGAVLSAGGGLADEPARTAPTAGPAGDVFLGEGAHRYKLDPTWGRLPAGMGYGFGCAIVVDGKDRVFVTSRSVSPCVAIFSPDGTLEATWAGDFATKVGITPERVAATAHGLYWSKEADGEFFYFTENKPGNRVYKTDLEGNVLYELGAVEKPGSAAQAFTFDNPTDVAVAPNGDIYIVDGYGSQLVHQFDKDFRHKKTIGGPGTEHGKFKTCHGIWVRTIGGEPEITIADRANDRLEVFDLDLEYKRTIEGVRKPCCFYQHDDKLFVPELDARVSIVDKDDRLVAHLGDGAGVDKAKVEDHPEVFFAPHALTLDSKGNLYVIEWLPNGRPRKFVPAPV